MNERIKQLLNEATSGHEQEHDKSKVLTVSNKEMEQFAELIIFECTKVAIFKDSGMVATADVAGYMAAGRSIAAQMIREHFEV